MLRETAAIDEAQDQAGTRALPRPVGGSRGAPAGELPGPAETLRLRDVMERTGFGKGMCFRLLYTLRHCGLLEKVDNNRYRLVSAIQRRKRYRIGYAAQGQDSSFAREVRAGLMRAAEREQVELIVVDNRYQPKIALRNAEQLIREGVDLVIEFQTDEAVAPAIAAGYPRRASRSIAIDIPHPGATYFGANNYEAGLLGRAPPRRAGPDALGRTGRRNPAARAGAGRIARRARACAAWSRGVWRDPARRGRSRGGSSRWTATASSRRRWNGCGGTCGSRRPARAGGRGQRSERARRGAGVPGGGPRRHLRDRRAERRARRPRRAARAAHAADRARSAIFRSDTATGS